MEVSSVAVATTCSIDTRPDSESTTTGDDSEINICNLLDSVDNTNVSVSDNSEVRDITTSCATLIYDEHTVPLNVDNVKNAENSCLEHSCDDHRSIHADEPTIFNKMRFDIDILIGRQLDKLKHRLIFLNYLEVPDSRVIIQSILPTVKQYCFIDEPNGPPRLIVEDRAINQADPTVDINQLVRELFHLMTDITIETKIKMTQLQSTCDTVDNTKRKINQILYDVIQYLLLVHGYLTIIQPGHDQEVGVPLLLKYYYAFSAWDSQMLNFSYIIPGDIFNIVQGPDFDQDTNTGLVIVDDVSYNINKKLVDSPMCMSNCFLLGLFVTYYDNQENIQIFEFIGIKTESMDVLLRLDQDVQLGAGLNRFNNVNGETYYISPYYLTFSFPRLAYTPATRFKFPIQTAINVIFEVCYNQAQAQQIQIKLSRDNIYILAVHLCQFDCMNAFGNMCLFYDDLIGIRFKRIQLPQPQGAQPVIQTDDSNCLYDEAYNAFRDHLNSGDDLNRHDVIPFKVFKKYLENYIVNFHTNQYPSLKMVAFSKITALNQFMIRRGWGFVDTAGGSLFNYIDRINVVTADYDFKIYFYEDAVKEIRKAYIKLWFINTSHNLNEYMRTNFFLKEFRITGELFCLVNSTPLATFEIGLNSKRPFISRGKEPELFPVPLYSDDLLLEMKICSAITTDATISKPCQKVTLKLNVSYFDLVFKDYDHHYISEIPLANMTADVKLREISNKISYITSTGPSKITNLDGNIVSPPLVPPFFLVRTPSFYEIWTDVTMLLTKPSFKLLRICTQKDGKDKIRFCKLLRQFLKYIQQQAEIQLQVSVILAPEMNTQQIDIFLDIFLKDEPFTDDLIRDIMPDQLIEHIINIFATNLTIIQLMLDYPMDHIAVQQYSENGVSPEQASLPYILVCYYQIIGFTNGTNPNYSGIFGICQNSFNIQFNIITNIYWGIVLWSKKYSELKDASDMSRLIRFKPAAIINNETAMFFYDRVDPMISKITIRSKNIDIFKGTLKDAATDDKFGEVSNRNRSTYAKIVDKLSIARQNRILTERLNFESIISHFRDVVRATQATDIIGENVLVNVLDTNAVKLVSYGGFKPRPKSRKHKRKHLRKPTRNKKSISKKNKTIKNKRKRRKNPRSKKTKT